METPLRPPTTEVVAYGRGWRERTRRISWFTVIGFGNTLIDIGILTLLIRVTGIDKGAGPIVFNVISYTCGLLNSYFWNSHLTFRQRPRFASRQSATFAVVTLAGLLLNTGTLYLLANLAPHPAGFSRADILLGAKVIATGLSFVWNYLFYRHVVFIHRPTTSA